jgi:hypothetical protein
MLFDLRLKKNLNLYFFVNYCMSQLQMCFTCIQRKHVIEHQSYGKWNLDYYEFTRIGYSWEISRWYFDVPSGRSTNCEERIARAMLRWKVVILLSINTRSIFTVNCIDVSGLCHVTRWRGREHYTGHALFVGVYLLKLNGMIAVSTSNHHGSLCVMLWVAPTIIIIFSDTHTEFN